MYILEILIKFIKNYKTKKRNNKFSLEAEPEEEICTNHIYFPIDSSKDYLACNNCGHVIKNNKNLTS